MQFNASKLIRPVEWKRETEIVPVSGRVAAVSVGGAGRWLVLAIPRKNWLEVFDINTHSIIGHIGTSAGYYRFAAGGDYIVVYEQKTRELTSYQLPTLEKKKSVQLEKGNIEMFAFGSASQLPGFALVQHKRPGSTNFPWVNMQRIDPMTLEVHRGGLDLDWSSSGVPWTLNYRFRIGCSANGRLCYFRNHHYSDDFAFRINGFQFMSELQVDSESHYYSPKPDGSAFFTSSGIETPRRLNTKEDRDYNEKTYTHHLAAHHGGYYIKTHDLGASYEALTFQDAELFDGNDRSVRLLPQLRYWKYATPPPEELTLLSLPDFIHILPTAETIVEVAAEEEHLVLHHVPIQKQVIERKRSVVKPATASLATNATAFIMCKQGSGTGFCISPKGYFVTNHHVIDDDPNPTIILNTGMANQKKYKATVVRSDSKSDLALIKLDDPPKRLDVLEISQHPPAIGDGVLAVGFPLGELLALARSEYPNISVNKADVTKLRSFVLEQNLIEFSAQVNPGNSGGPLVNGDGKIVGVVSATKVASGDSYAIPNEALREFLRPGIDIPELELGRSIYQEVVRFEVYMEDFLHAAEDLEVEFSIEVGNHKWQTVTLAYRGGDCWEGKLLLKPELGKIRRNGAAFRCRVSVFSQDKLIATEQAVMNYTH